MFIRPLPQIRKQGGIFLAQTTDHFVERARYEDLPGVGEIHDTRRAVDALTQSRLVAVDVTDNFYRAQVYTGADFIGKTALSPCADGLPQVEREEKRC